MIDAEGNLSLAHTSCDLKKKTCSSIKVVRCEGHYHYVSHNTFLEIRDCGSVSKNFLIRN